MPRLQLTAQKNPLAQTFRVLEKYGSVLTGIGLWFSKAPSGAGHPVVIELRPVVNGQPSSTEYYAGSQVKATPAQVQSYVNEVFDDAIEYKFTFPEPIYIPGNTEVALVISTSAITGRWKVWAGELGALRDGSTTELIKSQLDAGSLYESSNGTAWTASQNWDLAFRVYRAVFSTSTSYAHLDVDVPPMKRLTELQLIDNPVRFPRNPLYMTAGSTACRVLHPGHGFLVGDKVFLGGLDSADTFNGVSGASIVGTRSIDSADAFGYTIRMDQAASKTTRVGADKVYASEQAVVNSYGVIIPRNTPRQTAMSGQIYLTTHKSLAGNETPYSKLTDPFSFTFDIFQHMKVPYVVASKAQEDDPTKLNEQPSTSIITAMMTQDQYVAPSFNVGSSSFRTISYMLDYQQSNDSDISNRNYMTTLPYISETERTGGTTASKHISIPYSLAETATSIRVYMDARRPAGSDFKLWYRTATTSSDDPITKKQWKQFSISINPPNKSNYAQLGNHIDYREYEFNVYDIPDFDQYQIKITFHATNSSAWPAVKNLRTIATV